MIENARRAVGQVDADARARERRARVLYVCAVVGALVISLGALVVATFRAETSAQDVATRVAPVVAEQQIRDARQQRAGNARAVLDAANAALLAQQLPPVLDPGPGANADQLQIVAAAAYGVLLWPEPVKDQLRAEGRSVLSLPLPAPADPAAASSSPGAGSGGTSSGDDGAPTTTGRVEPSSASVPGPRSAPTVRAPSRPVGGAGPGPGSGAGSPGSGSGGSVGGGSGDGSGGGASAPEPQPERGGIRLELPLLPPIELPRLGLGGSLRLL